MCALRYHDHRLRSAVIGSDKRERRAVPTTNGFEGKAFAVTGGARGQGAAEVRLLAQRGARVLAGDVLTDELAALTEELGPDVLGLRLDVRDPAGWAEFWATGVDRFGGIDGLINNAGVAGGGGYLARAPGRCWPAGPAGTRRGTVR
jgi:NAD(P)-dependent dehydrogenase (short-subunit alcohol dehydrogenase family)